MGDDLDDSMRMRLLEYDLGKIREQYTILQFELQKVIIKQKIFLQAEKEFTRNVVTDLLDTLKETHDELVRTKKDMIGTRTSRGLAMLVFPTKRPEDLVCSICACEEEPITIHTCTAPLNCHHLFHSTCLTTYFESEHAVSLLCPLCKQ
jgi:hypothetical protein